mmetsp:Transcript_21319/g.47111  ORF Transcript_21319/g.47111 Transcript_21319/m.47111 type:complete len:281 (-) Transcript_21319:33-875(-)
MGCQCVKGTQVGRVQPPGGVQTSAPSKEVIAKKITQASSTRVLALRECGLKAVPRDALAPEMAKLRTADFSCNALSSLPEAIGSWTELQNLLCAQNAIAELPAAIGRMTNLQKLSLSQNRLRTLPSELSSLGKLKTLQLDRNQLGPGLPEFLEGPISGSLEEMDLSENLLERLPSLGNLRELQRLLLPRNKLRELPESLGGLQKLQYLDAAENSITTVAPRVLAAPSLSELWLKGNPLDRMRLQETAGFDAFLERRKQRLDEKIESRVVGRVDLSVCGLD